MNYKIIALDLDGTLLNKDKIITEKTRNALIKAQQSGVKVVLASGRMAYNMKEFATQLKLEEYGGVLLSFNGGLVIDCDGEVYSESYLERKYFLEVLQILEKTDITLVVHSEDKIFANANRNDYTDIEPKSVKMPLTQMENLQEYIKWDIHKMLLVGDPEKLQKLKIELYEKYSEKLEMMFSTPYFLELTPRGVNKGKAIKELCEKMNISLEEVIACGDNFNDLSMIKVAGLGVAMANAEDEIKENADYITLNDCDNDGIAEIVYKFIVK